MYVILKKKKKKKKKNTLTGKMMYIMLSHEGDTLNQVCAIHTRLSHGVYNDRCIILKVFQITLLRSRWVPSLLRKSFRLVCWISLPITLFSPRSNYFETHTPFVLDLY